MKLASAKPGGCAIVQNAATILSGKIAAPSSVRPLSDTVLVTAAVRYHRPNGDRNCNDNRNQQQQHGDRTKAAPPVATEDTAYSWPTTYCKSKRTAADQGVDVNPVIRQSISDMGPGSVRGTQNVPTTKSKENNGNVTPARDSQTASDIGDTMDSERPVGGENASGNEKAGGGKARRSE
ncbi:hypothetical protein O988_05822 [Pseudogymnoascus sp. VKM F-3808]|nr:hypothetical protein O988_05822 [Pseudogymnoascus sp. VKM F-3808]